MTVELFRANPYQQEFVARVTRRHRALVSLDQTCFAPGSLHHPLDDRGFLDEEVVTAMTVDSRGAPVHHLAEDLGSDILPLGAVVSGQIDWHRRYQAMRSHTATHLVELAVRATHEVTAISPTAPPIHGLTVAGPHQQLDLDAVTEWVSQAVREDLPMVVDQEAGLDGRWLWHLDGYGHRFCDGLHVLSTGEVGPVSIELASADPARLIVVVQANPACG